MERDSDTRTGVEGPGGEALAPQVLAVSGYASGWCWGVRGVQSVPQVKDLWGLRMGAVLRLLILRLAGR